MRQSKQAIFNIVLSNDVVFQLLWYKERHGAGSCSFLRYIAHHNDLPFPYDKNVSVILWAVSIRGKDRSRELFRFNEYEEAIIFLKERIQNEIRENSLAKTWDIY